MDGRVSPPASGQLYPAKASALAGAGLIAALALVFAVLCARRGNYVLMLGALALGAVPLGVTAWLRVELSPTWLRYRTVMGLRTVALDRIHAAWIDAPSGLWSYWRALPMLVLSVQGERPLVLNLKAVPDAAVVALGQALYRRGVGIGLADSPAARRVAARIWPPPRRRR